MSQPFPRANSLPNAGGHYYPPQSAQNQASAPGASHFIDGSGPIFSMYLGMAEEEDKKMAESWKADADGILIFTGLFSAAVASLISVSIQDIRQNPQDTSNFYLANIYQTMADPSRLNASGPSSPPPFTPPTFAVWVNGLWFLSLVISITCALLATLLQQWARRYLKATQPHYSLHKRARMRSFFAEGVDKSFLPLAVEALPALLHLSLFLFFAGLVVFLWNVDLTIFKVVLSWVGVCTALYGCISLTPIFRHDSPYYTPLTPLARSIAAVTLKFFLYLCLCFCCHPCYNAVLGTGRSSQGDDRLKNLLETAIMTPEEAALKASSLIDTRAFMWTFDSLDEDHELERFFSSLPEFRSSNVLDDPLPLLTEKDKEKISETLLRFLSFTFQSDLLPEAVKNQRAIMCAKALDLAQFSPASRDLLRDIIFYHRTRQTTNFGSIANQSPTEHNAFVQGIVTRIVTGVQQRDDYWYQQVAPNALGVPEAVLRNYTNFGDSLSLAVFLYVIRQQFTYFQYSSWPTSEIWVILLEGTKLDAENSLPELQQQFCTLWNQIVLKAQNDDDREIARSTLRPIRNVYLALHRYTDSAPTQFSTSTSHWADILELPSTYPVCKVHGHVHVNSPSSSFPSLELPPAVPANTTIEYPPFPLIGPPIPLQTYENSTSASLSSSPPSTIAVQHSTGQLTSSSPPNMQYLDSLDPVLDYMLPTESHHSMIVSTAPGAYPEMTVAPVPDSPDSPAPDLRTEQDTFDHSSVNSRTDSGITAAPDLPLQSPSLISVGNSDVAIGGRSSRELNAEHTGDHPLDYSRYQYDVV